MSGSEMKKGAAAGAPAQAQLGGAPSAEALGKRLKKWRLISGYTSRLKLNQRLGWSYRRYDNYEQGKSAIPLSALWDISRLYGITIDDLVGTDPVDDGRLRRLAVPVDEAALVQKALAKGSSSAEVMDAMDVLTGLLRRRLGDK